MSGSLLTLRRQNRTLGARFLAGMRWLAERVPSPRFWDTRTQMKAWYVWVVPVGLAWWVNNLMEPFHPDTLGWEMLEILHVVFWNGLSLGIFERYLRRKALERVKQGLALPPGAQTDRPAPVAGQVG